MLRDDFRISPKIQPQTVPLVGKPLSLLSHSHVRNPAVLLARATAAPAETDVRKALAPQFITI